MTTPDEGPPDPLAYASFIVDRLHIDLLTVALARFGIVRSERLDSVGHRLWMQNVSSVQSHHPGEALEDLPAQGHVTAELLVGYRAPAQWGAHPGDEELLTVLDCYVPACDWPGWVGSAEQRWTMTLRTVLDALVAREAERG